MSILKSLIDLIPHVTITIDGEPYLTRYYLLLYDWKWFNINLHHFWSSDQGLNLHSHPWKWSFGLMLFGGYVEERVIESILFPHGKIVKKIVTPGMINFITNRTFHRTDMIDERRGAWTLFVTGPRTNEWGFLDRETREFTHYSKNPEAIP